jgi:serine/threonine protein kinase
VNDPGTGNKPIEALEEADSDEPAESSWAFEQGDSIVRNRYALKLLGGGTIYEVYLAWDDVLFCLVVVKLLRPALVADRRSLRRIRREAEILGSLAHPMVLRSFDAVTEGDRPHLVMEYVEGTPLSSHLRRHRLQLEQLLPLFIRLASALHYLGSQGIVHLDVKPANVMVGAAARLIDFSLARPLAKARRLTSPIGTDPYMSPEQCDPATRGPLTPAADMWGLGASLWHALTGRAPFRSSVSDDGGARHFPQLVEPPPSMPADLPAPLAGMLDRCLASDPSARPRPAEFATALEGLVVG